MLVKREELRLLANIANHRALVDLLTRERDEAVRYLLAAADPVMMHRAQGRAALANDLLDLLTKSIE